MENICGGCNGIMTLQTFISKLNWRQVLIHFVAFWFFIYAFQTLSYLYNIKLVDVLRYSHGHPSNETYINNGITASDLSYFALRTSASGIAGLLAAFVISLIISLKRRWFWVNTLMAFILTYLLYEFNLSGWRFLKPVFGTRGKSLIIPLLNFYLTGFYF
jgi:hypothetical protein